VTYTDVLGRIIAALSGAGIPYMLTGSFASSYHGSLRATQDIDLVISPTPDQIRALVKLLPRSEYYVDEKTALKAVRRQGQFNVIDMATGWKIDFIVRKERPFSREEFARRMKVEFQGLEMFITSAEDLIIAKLEWGKRGESDRQIEDAAGILRIRGNELDRDYIVKWVEDLGLAEQWTEALQRADFKK
jgi:hypothetical protein